MSSLRSPPQTQRSVVTGSALVVAAADQVEQRRGELVRADPRPLRDERGDERGLELGRRLLLVLAVVADVELAAVAPVHEEHEADRRDEREQREQRERARQPVDRVVDLLAALRVLLGGARLLLDDRFERRAFADGRARRGGEVLAREEDSRLDELTGRDVERAQRAPSGRRS